MLIIVEADSLCRNKHSGSLRTGVLQDLNGDSIRWLFHHTLFLMSKLRYFNNHFIIKHVNTCIVTIPVWFCIYCLFCYSLWLGFSVCDPSTTHAKVNSEYSSAKKWTLGVMRSWELYLLQWIDAIKRAPGAHLSFPTLLPHEHRASAHSGGYSNRSLTPDRTPAYLELLWYLF